MSPIIITRCKCEPKKNIYVSIPREVYFKEDMKNHDWQLEYSKRVKEEKYKFYKENVISEGDIWIEYDKKGIFCEKCGKKVEL
jgi:uncharacterized protein YcnI